MSRKRVDVVITVVFILFLAFMNVYIIKESFPKTGFAGLLGANDCSEGNITASCDCEGESRDLGYCCNNLYYTHGCLDRYGGYKGIISVEDPGYNGNISSSSSNQVSDLDANFPDLTGRYLVFNNLNFSDPTLADLNKRFEIISNDATTITTAAGDGDLTTYASVGDEYAVMKENPFFTVEKIDNRWWFITPEGNVYWMVGVNMVTGIGDGGADLFNPAVTDVGSDGVTAAHDYNVHKYGTGDRVGWSLATAKKLSALGFNNDGYGTAISCEVCPKGNNPIYMPSMMNVRWGYYAMDARAAYNYSIGNIMQSSSNNVGGRFPDVFNPNWRTGMVSFLEDYYGNFDPYENNSWIMGYYVDEEPRGFGDRDRAHYHLGAVVVMQPAEICNGFSCENNVTNYGKIAFRNYLRRQYGADADFNNWLKTNTTGTTAEWQSAPGWSSADDSNALASLNSAWNQAYTSWDSDGGHSIGTGVLDEDFDSSDNNFTIIDENNIERSYLDWYSSGDLSAAMLATWEQTANNPNVADDLDGFLVEMSREYFKPIYETHKAVNPNQLNLGPQMSIGAKLGPRQEIVQGMKSEDGTEVYIDVIGGGDGSAVHSYNYQGNFIFDENAENLAYIYSELGVPFYTYTYWVPGTEDSPLYYEGIVDEVGTNYIIENDIDFLATRGSMAGAVWIKFDGIDDHFLISSNDENNITFNGYCPSWGIVDLPSLGVQAGDSFKFVPGMCPASTTWYSTQEDRGLAYTNHLEELTNLTNGQDYYYVGATMWRYQDPCPVRKAGAWVINGDYTNFGLVTCKDNAYDGIEATTLGADGISGTWDDENATYGDFLTSVESTNKNIYNYILGNDLTCTDNDGDGYNQSAYGCGAVDCDDTDDAVNPSATETCNLVDDDCDDSIDEGGVCANDQDADGIEDDSDNCVNVSNAGQVDFDLDSFGDACDRCPLKSGPDNPNNKFGCPPPVWALFRNNMSTNLSNVANFHNITLELGIPTKGTVSFIDNVSVGGVDFDSHVVIEGNYVEINASGVPELNTSSTIALYNVSGLNNPQINRDGETCSDCTLLSYDNDSIVFTVPHFTKYEIVEGPYCGDGTCNGGETCSSCADCGNCDGGGGGGGGGGGSSEPADCVPYWQCTSWSVCRSDGTSIRTCNDLNQCGEEAPSTERECYYYVPEPEVEENVTEENETIEEEPPIEQPVPVSELSWIQQYWSAILVLIASVSVLFVGGYYTFRGVRRHMMQKKALPSGPLVEYVGTCLSKNFPKEQIILACVSAGWRKADVKRVIEEIQNKKN